MLGAYNVGERIRAAIAEQRVTTDADPPKVLVGSTATTNYSAFVGYSWYGVWGFYPGWTWYAPGFDASWTIVYPWYPTSGVVAYDRGTLVVDLIPTLSVNPLAKSIRSAWAGVATTLLNGTTTESTVTAAIDQMFALSPYLTAVR